MSSTQTDNPKVLYIISVLREMYEGRWWVADAADGNFVYLKCEASERKFLLFYPKTGEIGSVWSDQWFWLDFASDESVRSVLSELLNSKLSTF
jgi:hypothetical protein